eukprot:COSAG06_NODE_1156_length_10478_cov_5.792177_11_plen_46_part_00
MGEQKPEAQRKPARRNGLSTMLIGMTDQHVCVLMLLILMRQQRKP